MRITGDSFREDTSDNKSKSIRNGSKIILSRVSLNKFNVTPFNDLAGSTIKPSQFSKPDLQINDNL